MMYQRAFKDKEGQIFLTSPYRCDAVYIIGVNGPYDLISQSLTKERLQVLIDSKEWIEMKESEEAEK